MQFFNKIQEYSDQVCQQIRWKKAKAMIDVEIKNHLCDQRDAYISHGDNEEIATEKAILQMGDAELIGLELDKTHKPQPQWLMILFTGILMITGLCFNAFITSSIPNSISFGIVHYILAFGIFLLCYYSDFSIFGKHPKKIYLLTLLFATILVRIPGTTILGKSYFMIGGLSISLAYLCLIFPLAFSLILYSMKNQGLRGIFISGLAYLPLAMILSIIPTASGLLAYTITALIMLCFAICRGWFGVSKKQGLSLVLIPTVSLFSLFIFTISRSSKALAFLNPQEYIQSSGYLYYFIREFRANAVFFGKGGYPAILRDTPLPEITKYLPNISTDYSLIYLTHQFGFVVLFGIITLLLVFSIIGISKALKEKSMLGSLIALTIIITFIVQSVFFIMDNLGYGFVASISLPFVSYGTSSLFINSALVGLMLSVFRTGAIFTDYSNTKNNTSRCSYEDGKLIITLRASHVSKINKFEK